jgi:disulfide bond formation protein DsbB
MSSDLTTGVRQFSALALISVAVCALAFATIATALAYEVWGGYLPCPLCIQQRYAYYFAVPASAFAYVATRIDWPSAARLLLAAIALGFVVNAGLGFYHAGVEWRWWEGTAACEAAAQLAEMPGDLLAALDNTRVIRCDEAPWRFLGLSFAGWNVLTSALLAGLAGWGVVQKR